MNQLLNKNTEITGKSKIEVGRIPGKEFKYAK